MSATGPGEPAKANWLQETVKHRGIRSCIPGRKSRSKTVRHDKGRYRHRNWIEIIFGRQRDWPRVATRHDSCAKLSFSAVAVAATLMCWL